MYVKGILRPNNSIGRRLQSIANGLRRTPYRDGALSQGLLEEEIERNIENNGEIGRERDGIIPHSPLRRQMIRGQLERIMKMMGKKVWDKPNKYYLIKNSVLNFVEYYRVIFAVYFSYRLLLL